MSEPLIANQTQASHIIPARQASDIVSQCLCDSFAELSQALQSKLFHSKALHKIRNLHYVNELYCRFNLVIFKKYVLQ